MSRSAYDDDYDYDLWDTVRWRGAVDSAIRGRRGQAFLRELAAALDAMPEKRLIAEHLEYCGHYCALGAIGKARGMDLSGINQDKLDVVAKAFGIAKALAAEVMDLNDNALFSPDDLGDPDAARWRLMREWVEERIRKEAVV